MRPEDVPVELVEKAHRARLSAQIGGAPITDYEYESLRSDIEANWMAAALAAVLPTDRASVLRGLADSLAGNGGDLSGGSLIGPIGLRDLADDMEAK